MHLSYFVCLTECSLLFSSHPFLAKFSPIDTHPNANLSQGVSVCLCDMGVIWVSVPSGYPTGACYSVSESLYFQTRSLVSDDKSLGTEPLTLQLQCGARSQRELGDSRATSSRQLHSLITEGPEKHWASLGTTDMEYF